MKNLLLIFLFLPTLSSSQTWQWVQQEGGNNNDYIYAISTDSVNNCYIAGRFGISKYSYSGSHIWHDSTTYWSLGVCYLNNRVYTVGDSFGVEIASQYDVNGNLMWQRNFGAGGNAFSKIIPGKSGCLYVAGSGASFLSKLDTAGNLAWAKNSTALANSICTDNVGNIYLTGYFSGTAHFGGDSLTAVGYQDIFIAKYDSLGNCLWAERAGGNSPDGYHDDFGWGITADTLGHVYITGSFYGIADFGADTLYGMNANDVFVAKYDSSGNELWVKAATGWSDQEGRCITLNAEGNILIGGSFTGEIFFDSFNVDDSCFTYEPFIAKYDPNGNFISVITAHDFSGNAFVRGICADYNGNVFVTGEFSSWCTFGTYVLNTGNTADTYIGKIDFSTGIEEPINSTSDFYVYPNPVTDKAVFQFGNAGQLHSVLIFDQAGREIFRTETEENQVEFFTEGLAPGLYYYRVLEETGKNAAGKLVIE